MDVRGCGFAAPPGPLACGSGCSRLLREGGATRHGVNAVLRGRHVAVADRRARTCARSRSGCVTMQSPFDLFRQKKKEPAVEGDSKKDAKKPASGLGGVFDYVRQRATEDIQKVRVFQDGLAKSREKLARDLTAALAGVDSKNLDEVFERLEEVLITSDLGVDTVDAVLEDLRSQAVRQRLETDEDIRRSLKASLVRILEERGGIVPTVAPDRADAKAPIVIMVIGANGMGKTTTIGKLALRYRKQGKRVLLAACDTFRAAAVEQLAEWAKRADAEIVVPRENQKSASGVVFDAVKRAHDEAYDVLIVDTSGRLHTNVGLMDELKKIFSVVRKARPGNAGPDETLLVVDASIGRNAVMQARTWNREVGVTGLVVTKLDGTARAGFVVSVVDELGIPVKLVGVGEKIEDLRDFEPVPFVEGLPGSKSFAVRSIGAMIWRQCRCIDPARFHLDSAARGDSAGKHESWKKVKCSERTSACVKIDKLTACARDIDLTYADMALRHYSRCALHGIIEECDHFISYEGSKPTLFAFNFAPSRLVQVQDEAVVSCLQS
ncbi:Cell division protein FtsY-like, chloroplastic [Porphyridium purpureum]|uniref:Cell division protein FtsY-like, chloroplastic n=1 Tax=Porphyridium purpureum TaxID=35688 RepID=A0A5J4YI77_PORPP|nr:Cell division protein FtsY-like, chloroplastic [Porphyridium purpureum]|eukprot:POR5437..scf270_19